MTEGAREADGQHIVIAGGGTGGHVNPGLAIARELLRRDPARVILFVGTEAGLETRLVPAAGFRLRTIRASGLVGVGIGTTIRGLGRLPLGWLDSRRILARFRPRIVIGVGGYASGPVLLAALAGRLPTMIHEQNRFPGVTNRILSGMVDRIAVSFDGTAGAVGRRGEVTGNPVRPEFTRIAPWQPPDRAARLLVFGGSRGARSINGAMLAALPHLRTDLEIRHQTGPSDRDEVSAGYERAGRRAQVESYIDDMASALEAADVVVCRAGASTLAELAVAGRASILVPFPHAAHDHQRHNAAGFMEAGAARVVDPDELDGRSLAGAIEGLVEDPGTVAELASAARRLARPDAASRIADIAEGLMEAAA